MTKLTLIPGRKSASDRLQRRHHVSDGSLRKILCGIRVVTGTGNRRSFHRDVRFVHVTLNLA